MSNQSSSRSERIIVFGANGFLGSLTTKRLHNSGFDVLPVVRPGANKSRLSGLINLDILEISAENWPQAVTQNFPDTVVCAQWSGVSKQDRDNFELQSSNIEPILNLAHSAKESKARNFICFGSQAEAKESKNRIKEDFYSSGESAYGITKSNLHSKLATLFKSSNCRFIWARVFSVYGPSDFSDSLLMRLFESQITNSDLVITNPTKFWSFLYEDDFATAIEEIVNNSNISGTVNVGSPVFNEIRELVAIWKGNSQTDSRVYQPDQGNIGFFPDLGKLYSVGWSPSISLQEGVLRTQKAFNERTH